MRAWHTGAVGEEEFGRKLSVMASETLKVLHDLKVPRSAPNIDHLAVTSEAVSVLDAKCYKGTVETRRPGRSSGRDLLRVSPASRAAARCWSRRAGVRWSAASGRAAVRRSRDAVDQGARADHHVQLVD
jgi:nuclease-like protein